MNTRWEYSVLKFATTYRFVDGTEIDENELQAKLNLLGSDGWELVSMSTVEMRKGGTKAVLATLKRPVASN